MSVKLQDIEGSEDATVDSILRTIHFEIVKLKALPPEQYARSVRLLEAGREIIVEAARLSLPVDGSTSHRERFIGAADTLIAALEDKG